MTADLLIEGIAQLTTPAEAGPARGRAMRELRTIVDAAMAVTAGRVAWCGRRRDWAGQAAEKWDCGGRAVVPALIDPHTHAVWAGDRLGDFEARAAGVTYEQMLAAGGGIRSTIRATAACPVERLVELTRPRIEALVRSGAATIEVKSGYGFDPDAEMRMLEAIGRLAEQTPARLIPTLLIHMPPVERKDRDAYLEQVRLELIPRARRSGLARALDVFVEKEAWTAREAEGLMDAASEPGASMDTARYTKLHTKLHTEQFHRVGGLELGIRKDARSVDHLEAGVSNQWAALAGSATIGTILPGVTLHLGIPAANGRALVDAGAAVAVGTDLNPGSSPLFSMAMALGLAVRLNGLTPAEALTAGTVNAASALGLDDCGRMAAGMRADFLVLAGADWRDLIYTMGASVVRETWIAGKRAHG